MPLDDTMKSRLVLALPGLKTRAKTLVDLVDAAKFLFASRPLALDKKAAKALSSDNATEILRDVSARLGSLAEWNAETLETAVRDHAEANDVKLGAIAQPLRAALTGCGVSPGIFDVLVALGREESLGRIGDQLE
ncbi:MAG: glutamate--tRNA ligase, partial [Hyphomicrobiales bacterium]